MNFFSRLGNVISGFFSNFMGGLEESNPAAVYEAAINERLIKHKELKKAISGIVYLRNKTQTELEDSLKELNEIEYQLEAALESGEDDMAVMLIERQDALQEIIKQQEADLMKVSEQADESKIALQQFQAEIKKLKREKEEMLAKVETAEARIKIQESLDGLSLDADVQALDNVRSSIHKKVAEADVNAEMANSSLDNKLAKLKEKGSSLKAQRKLEEMKRKRAGIATPKTESQKKLEALKKVKEAQVSENKTI